MTTPSSARSDVHAPLGLHRYRAGVRRGRQLESVGRQRSATPLGPPMQEALDRVTYLAGQALDAPAVCVSLVDAERRLLASSYGLPVPTALLISHAFHKHIVASRRPLVVADGRRDPLVAQNPAVRDGTVRSCVGMPFGTADGRTIGTLLAMDPRPRRWTAPQLDLLDKLSALIVSEVEVGAAVRRTWRTEVSLPQVNQYGRQS
ncbi:MAG: GAF domain-containing protein [Gemmatimonadales bacterium]